MYKRIPLECFRNILFLILSYKLLVIGLCSRCLFFTYHVLHILPHRRIFIKWFFFSTGRGRGRGGKLLKLYLYTLYKQVHVHLRTGGLHVTCMLSNMYVWQNAAVYRFTDLKKKSVYCWYLEKVTVFRCIYLLPIFYLFCGAFFR